MICPLCNSDRCTSNCATQQSVCNYHAGYYLRNPSGQGELEKLMKDCVDCNSRKFAAAVVWSIDKFQRLLRGAK